MNMFVYALYTIMHACVYVGVYVSLLSTPSYHFHPSYIPSSMPTIVCQTVRGGEYYIRRRTHTIIHNYMHVDGRGEL